MARTTRAKKPATARKPPIKKAPAGGKRVPKFESSPAPSPANDARRRSSRRALANLSNRADSVSDEDGVPAKKAGRRAVASYAEGSESESEPESGPEVSESGSDGKDDDEDDDDAEDAPKRKKGAAKKSAPKKRAVPKKKAAPKKEAPKKAAGGRPPRAPGGGKKARGEAAQDEASAGSPEVIHDFTQKFAHEDPEKERSKRPAKSVTPRSAGGTGGDYANVESHERRTSIWYEEELRAEVSDWRVMGAVDW